MSDNIQHRADQVLATLTEFLVGAKNYMKDTSLPLEERWALYLKIEKQLPISKYLSRSLRKLTDSAYDDFFCDGRGFMFNSDIDNSLVERYEDWVETPSENDTDDDTACRQAAYELYTKRDAWREAVLVEGIGGQAFDW